MDLVLSVLSAVLAVVGAALLFVLLVAAAAFAACRALGRRAVRRRLALAPGVPCAGPVRWLWSASPAARLHRRLQAVATLLGGASSWRAGRAVGLDDLAQRVVHEAAALDARLAVADRVRGPARRRLVEQVAGEVRELEAVAQRLVATSWALARDERREQPALAEVTERLDALDAALREVELAR